MIAAPSSDKPLCVDLDGTLVRTDTCAESILALLARNPFLLFPMLAWLARGKAYFKARVAERTSFNASLLPYSSELLEYLRSERARGRRLALATASDESVARQVEAHLHLFDEVIASNGDVNLAGSKKLEALEARYGKGGFAYAGNARVDVPIWREADHAILVNTRRSIQRKLERDRVRIARVFPAPKSALRGLIRALRPHQWAKNLLIFVPLVFGHKLGDIQRLKEAAVAFAAFCFCASSVYVLNDVLDIEADRKHHLKRTRPFAAGEIPVGAGLAAVPLLLGLSLAISGFSPYFTGYVAGYFVVTLGYSMFLKRLPIVDVLLLAGLYTLRIMAGGAATDVVISPWLLGFSMFLFLSLALVKRYSELRALGDARGYTASDLPQLSSFGTASGYIAVLVLALYINSADVRILYSRPLLLWMVCPLLIYWISRVWLLAHRGELHDDPVLFALKDKISYVTGLLVALVMLAAL